MKKILLTLVLLITSMASYSGGGGNNNGEIKTKYETIMQGVSKFTHPDISIDKKIMERVFVHYKISDQGDINIIDMSSSNIVFEKYVENKLNNMIITNPDKKYGVLVIKFILR